MNTNIAKISDSKKIATFGSDKNLQSKITQIDDNDSLAFWIQNYFDKMILRGKSKTKKAKKIDLQKFLSFFVNEIGSYHIDNWTLLSLKVFKDYYLILHRLQDKITKLLLLIEYLQHKHCASWIGERREFAAGNHFEGVKDLMQDEPDWNGLTDRQLMLLRSAIDTD